MRLGSLLSLITFLPATFGALSVDQWVEAEEPIARNGILRNIGGGEFAKSAAKGVVIASPSTSSPDYYYQWTRDAGMVMKALLNIYINGNSSMEQALFNYADQSDIIQRVNNPSGGYTTGGLGEPKYNVDNTAFTGNWGRPQPDGPALRAIALTKFANVLLDGGKSTDYVKSKLYDGKYPTNSVIKSDLEYVANYWQTSGFDLWEEVQGRHFFTHMVQYRALLEGADLADRLNDSGAANWYRQQATAIKAYLPNFWDKNKGYLVATLNNGRSGQDCGTLLGSLHGNGKAGHGMYEPSSDEVLATLKALVDSMTTLYPINTQSGAPGIAIGRYPSDIYDGVGTSIANPWFICTFTTAEILYTASKQFDDRGNITVSSITQPFFKKFASSVQQGTTYTPDTPEYGQILSGLKSYADSFVSVGQLHAANNGSMSEQYGRTDGLMKGARDLTWSYASFLTMRWAKRGEIAF